MSAVRCAPDSFCARPSMNARAAGVTRCGKREPFSRTSSSAMSRRQFAWVGRSCAKRGTFVQSRP